MKGAGAWAACLAGGLIALLSLREARRLEAHTPPWFDPAPLGPAAGAFQGPLAAGRTFLVPFCFMEVQSQLLLGRPEQARRAALRLLAVAPWLAEVWLHIGWSLAFRVEESEGAERAGQVAAAEAWLALASRVLPRSPDPPATAAFILAECLPPGSPSEKAWSALQGGDPASRADAWLEEALRRAPERAPLLSRRSGIAVRLAGLALARGAAMESRALLERALDLERRLADRGSPIAREWIGGLEALREALRGPLPWPALVRTSLRKSAAGRIFLEALGADPE